MHNLCVKHGKVRRRLVCAVWVVCTVLLAVLATVLRAQTNAGGPSPARRNTGENYAARLWQTQNGLPEQTVQAFAQTRDGFLWIGTTGGLLRFDGSRFVPYDRGNTPAFRENSVFSLTTGRNGTLWIGTEGGGLLRFRDGNFRRFGLADGLLDGFVRTVLEDSGGQIWIGTDNGVFLLGSADAEHVTRVDGTPAMPAMAVHALAQAADGRVWIGGSQLVALRPGGAVQTYPLVGEFGETRVKSILQTREGTVWVGTVSGLQRLVPGAGSFARFAGVHGTVRTLHETADATLWIGTIGQGAYRLRAGRLAAVDSGDADAVKLPSKTVLSIAEDAESNVWMGTQAGMLRFSRSPIALISLPNASDSDFETVSADRDGTLWVAGTRLSHLVNGAATPVDFPELHEARVRNVFRSHDGALWIGTDGRGLFRLQAGTPARQYTTANGLVNNFVRGIMEARSGDLWVATDEGVSRLSEGTLRNFTVQDGLAYFSVRALLEDRTGGIWIGTDRGLSHLVGDRFQSDTATAALAAEKVWALNQSDSGSLWFGTRDDGLYRYVPGEATTTHTTTEQGLVSNSMYALLEDARHRFWISGAKGVEVISIGDLESPGREARRLAQRFFAVSEGGELSPPYGGTQPAGALTPDGNAWFPTSKGPVRFLADETVSSAVPQVFIDQVVADGHRIAAGSKPVLLPADDQGLEIAYGSILLSSQESVQYQYKLESFDRDWHYGSAQRVAAYTNLPAGRYTFRVRAFEGGSAGSTERTLVIVKRQYFFLTWWFLSACLAALVFSVWWVHHQRLKRAQTAFEAVLEERARLAREMHDTLIQGCAGVSLLLEACSAEEGDQAGQSELLDYARTQLAASIDEARQAVWNLREQDSADFGEVLKKLTERVDRSSNIAVGCEVNGDSYPFDSFATHEIAMASREAIYNALLHANPSRIEVRAVFGAEEFALTVRDDGSGFESGGDAPKGHFGLLGMQERIQRIGGRVLVKTAVASGTTVFIAVPRSRICLETARKRSAVPGVLGKGAPWQS